MKKIIHSLFISALTISTFTACGPSKAEIQAKQEAQDNEAKRIGDSLAMEIQKQNNEAAPSENQTEEKSVTSVEFLKNSLADNFFEKDNLDKAFVMSDLLITDYNLSLDGNEAILEAYAYNPETKKCYIVFTGMGNGMHESGEKTITLNGDKIECATDFKFFSHNYYYLHLSDPKQLKLLKLYDPIVRRKSAYKDGLVEIKDLIKIRGTFSRGAGLSFSNVEIIN